jgi:hypothetical protein
LAALLLIWAPYSARRALRGYCLSVLHAAFIAAVVLASAVAVVIPWSGPRAGLTALAAAFAILWVVQHDLDTDEPNMVDAWLGAAIVVIAFAVAIGRAGRAMPEIAMSGLSWLLVIVGALLIVGQLLSGLAGLSRMARGGFTVFAAASLSGGLWLATHPEDHPDLSVELTANRAMSIALIGYTVVGAVWGLITAVFSGRVTRTNAAAVRLRNEAIGSRRRQPWSARLRSLLVGTLTLLRGIAWWPATIAVGVRTALRPDRVRSAETIDAALLLAGVVLLIVGSTRTTEPAPVVAWTWIFLAVIIGRNLLVLLLGDAYFSTHRRLAGNAYLRFCLVALCVSAGIVGLSLVVTALDSGLPLRLNQNMLTDVPLALLPNNVIPALVDGSGNASALRIAVDVAAVLTYFLLFTQVLRFGRFRRTKEDYLLLAGNALWVGDYAAARHWLDGVGPDDAEAAVTRGLIDIAEGRPEDAWDRQESFLRVIGRPAATDDVWYNLYLQGRHMPLRDSDWAALLRIAVSKGVSDGTLALAFNASIMTGLDLRGVEWRLREAGADPERDYPVATAMARSLLDDRQGALQLLERREHGQDDTTRHVAAIVRAMAGFWTAVERDRLRQSSANAERRRSAFALAADPLCERFGETDFSAVSLRLRAFVAATMATLHILAQEFDPARGDQLKILIAGAVEGTEFTAGDVIANQAELMARTKKPGGSPIDPPNQRRRDQDRVAMMERIWSVNEHR